MKIERLYQPEIVIGTKTKAHAVRTFTRSAVEFDSDAKSRKDSNRERSSHDSGNSEDLHAHLDTQSGQALPEDRELGPSGKSEYPLDIVV